MGAPDHVSVRAGAPRCLNSIAQVGVWSRGVTSVGRNAEPRLVPATTKGTENHGSHGKHGRQGRRGGGPRTTKGTKAARGFVAGTSVPGALCQMKRRKGGRYPREGENDAKGLPKPRKERRGPRTTEGTECTEGTYRRANHGRNGTHARGREGGECDWLSQWALAGRGGADACAGAKAPGYGTTPVHRAADGVTVALAAWSGRGPLTRAWICSTLYAFEAVWERYGK